VNHSMSDYLTAQQVDLLMRDLHPARIMNLDGN
jgi:hypothetical protein